MFELVQLYLEHQVRKGKMLCGEKRGRGKK